MISLGFSEYEQSLEVRNNSLQRVGSSESTDSGIVLSPPRLSCVCCVGSNIWNLLKHVLSLRNFLWHVARDHMSQERTPTLLSGYLDSREERRMGARQALVGPAGAEQSPPCCFAEMSTFLGVPLVKAINT